MWHLTSPSLKGGQYGLLFPVFFCRDPIQGPDVIRPQSCSPTNFLLDHDALLDFLTNTPEANHVGLMFFSDHGTFQGWRFNDGYSCYTFNEAMQMCGEDSGYSQRHLWEAIENREEIEWAAHVQAMDPRQAHPDKLRFDPFDVTKVWPRSQFPMKESGRLVLDKNPENFHRDVGQAAFRLVACFPVLKTRLDLWARVMREQEKKNTC
ncbi:catalase [Fusarium bulbicola]|nr:catalase [Fusarium bulbicola]